MRGAESTRVPSLSVWWKMVTKGRQDYVGPEPWDKRVNHFSLSYLRHDVQFHDVGSHHEGSS